MATENRKLRVFLCHSKDDKTKVRKLYNRLIADGFDVWFDEVKLMPGQNWDLEIRKAVGNSDTVIVCLTRSSTTKEGYIQKEIRFALDIADEKPEGTIFLIPVRLEECNAPTRINRFQWIDLFKRFGYSKLKEALHLRMDDLHIRFDSYEVKPKALEDTIVVPILGPIASDEPLPEADIKNELMVSPEFNSILISRDVLPLRENGDGLYALEVKGDGLVDAMINDGDVVVMKHATSANDGEMVAIWLPENNEAALRYFYEEKNRYRLEAANPKMKPIFVSKSIPLEIKGKVIIVIRRMTHAMGF